MREDDLRRLEEEIDKLRTKIVDADDFKVYSEILDRTTLMALYKLSKRGSIEALGGVLSSGKEANVLHALGSEGEVAVKVYRIYTSDFRNMYEYIEGDPRFMKVRKDRRSVVMAWARKEFRNLKIAEKAGVRVPHPIDIESNVLVMEFIGEDETPAPRLKDIENDMSKEDMKRICFKIIEYVKRLYEKGDLVHGDVSEYNILVHRNEIFLIDIGQAVLTRHPRAMEFLRRDLENISRYFRRFGIKVDANDLFSEVTS
jgi:RIO kinase 1